MPSIAQIKAAVCAEYGIGIRELDSDSREARLAGPRQVAYYLARRVAGRSYQLIGREFRRDHSTVCHGTRKIEARADDPVVARLVAELLA